MSFVRLHDEIAVRVTCHPAATRRGRTVPGLQRGSFVARPASPLRRWLRRAIEIVVVGGVGAWALYIVAMNVFLKTRLLRDVLSGEPDEFLVDYVTAYSIVPGRMHVEGLSIRGRDSSVEWILHVDTCDFRVAFADLAHRRFHATRVHGDGLTLRVRQRMPSYTPAAAHALPPVPGFADPPLSGAEPPYLSDLDYNLWTVWLEGVDADHVREIWVDTVRAAGDFDVHGRWFFRPLRWLDVGPALIDARQLDVSYGLTEAWVAGGAGHLTATLAPTNLQVESGSDMVNQASLSGDLHGFAYLAAPVNRVLDRAGSNVERAETRFDVTVALDRGALRAPTRVHLDPFELLAREEGIDVATSLEVGARIDDGGGAHGEVALRHVRLSHDGAPIGAVNRLDAKISTRDSIRAAAWSDATYALDLDGVETSALAYWKERFHLAEKYRADAEMVTVSGHLAGGFAHRSAAGHLHLGLRQFAVAGVGWGAATDATSDVQVVGSLSDGNVDLSGSTLALRAGHGEIEGVALSAPLVTVNARRLVREPAGILGEVSLESSDLEAPSLAKIGALLPMPRGITVDGGSARADVHVELDLGQGAAAGSAHLAVRDVRVRAGSRVIVGSLDVYVRAKQLGATTDVSGSSVELHESKSSGWWARVDASHALVSFAGAPRFRAHVAIAAKDASPVTAFLEDHQGAATKLAIGAIPTTALRGGGEIVVAPANVEARSFAARTDGFQMALEFAKIGREQILDLYLVVGLVHAGIDVTDGKTRVYLFGAEPWFDAKVASLRAYERRYE
jgi:hypothetical protein